MKTFKYTLKNNQPKRYKNQKYTFVVLGAFYLVLSFLQFFVLIKDSISSYINFIAGLIIIIIGLFKWWRIDKFFIQFGNSGVSGNVGNFKNSLKWTKITKTHIGLITIYLTLSDGKTIELPLDNLGYNDVKLVKSEFQEFANKNGIKIK